MNTRYTRVNPSKYTLLALVLLVPTLVLGQSSQSISKKYPFIKESLNQLCDDSLCLNNFYSKLLDLKNGNQQELSIVHIGDSHIQADMFSGKVRVALQKAFGNAGRGLVFPYKVAKTNGPQDFRISSNVIWQSKRVVSTNDPLTVGVSGLTIRTNADSAFIRIKLNSHDSLNYKFNRVTLFQDKTDSAFDFSITDTSKRSLGFIKSTTIQDNRFTSTIILDTLIDEIIIKTVRQDSTQKYAQIYGIVLENSKPGIIYNMIGVNGAEYKHFNQDSAFQDQIKLLNPDLVIISLGTNEAFRKTVDKEAFQENLNKMISDIRTNNPHADVLITTPPDSYKRKRYKNANVTSIQRIMLDYCNKQNVAYWDFYSIMGGFGSMSKWATKNLAKKDKIHLTNAGYILQAELFNNALMNGFKRFEHRLQ